MSRTTIHLSPQPRFYPPPYSFPHLCPVSSPWPLSKLIDNRTSSCLWVPSYLWRLFLLPHLHCTVALIQAIVVLRLDWFLCQAWCPSHPSPSLHCCQSHLSNLWFWFPNTLPENRDKGGSHLPLQPCFLDLPSHNLCSAILELVFLMFLNFCQTVLFSASVYLCSFCFLVPFSEPVPSPVRPFFSLLCANVAFV